MEANHITVFVPGVRYLTELEISQLPQLRVRLAETSDPKGIWLDVPCPDLACLSGEDRITLQATGVLGKKKEREERFSVEDVLF